MKILALAFAAALSTSSAFAAECQVFVSNDGGVIDWSADRGSPGHDIDFTHPGGSTEECYVWALSEGDWPFSLVCESFEGLMSYDPQNNDQIWLGSEDSVYSRRCD